MFPASANGSVFCSPKYSNAVVSTTSPSVMGISRCHAIRMIWSNRNRGSVQRIHMVRKIRDAIFPERTSILASTAYHWVASGCVHDNHGRCQPPRNRTQMNAEAVIMWEYSAKKNMPNFSALYSV